MKTMKLMKRKTNKIPRMRLPSLERTQVTSQPKVRFFHKIQHSFNLLQQPPLYKNSTNQSPQQKKPIESSTQFRKKFISSRIQRLAMPRDFNKSSGVSIEKQNHFNSTQGQVSLHSKSQKTSRVKENKDYSFSNNHSKKHLHQPQYISSKPLGDQSLTAYRKINDESPSPVKKSLINLQTASNKDQHDHDHQNDEQNAVPTPMLLDGIMSLASSIQQKMRLGKQIYLYNRIMGDVPYSDKYQQFHKKLVQRDKAYQAKKFHMNHKNDWRT